MADAVTEQAPAPVEAEKPVEEVEAPAVEVPADEAPAEEAPAEEAPVEEAPAEEAPVEEAPAAEAVEPSEPAPAENGTTEAPEESYELPKKRGRPSGGAKRTPKKVKVPTMPTRRSARRSASRSSEASTPTDKREEPIEKENFDSENTAEEAVEA